MSKIRGDVRLMALAHQTRMALYESLRGKEEMSTVQLQKATGVTRYHLYHHLQQMVKAGLVENNRDAGRTRFWRLIREVEIPTASAEGELIPQPQTRSERRKWFSSIPEELRDLMRRGAEVEWTPIGESAQDAVAARRALTEAAALWGIQLDLPITFMPRGILIIGQPRDDE